MTCSAAEQEASESYFPARRFGRAHGGILFKLLAPVAAVSAFAVLAWILFLPAFITHRIRGRTGFDATIAQLACNPFTGTIEMKGFVLTNPPTFPVKEFVELKSFSAKAGGLSLTSNPLVFETMDVELGNVTLIKRSDGVSNSAAFERNLADFAGEPGRLASDAPARSYLVKRLRVRVSQLTVVDYVRGVERKRVYRLDLDQTYIDVTSLRQLAEPKTLAVLEPVALVARDLLPSGLRSAVEDALKPAATFVQDRAREAANQTKGFFDALEESKKP
jgi:hypothetical protein